jgi:Tol biopolymer transport system component
VLHKEIDLNLLPASTPRMVRHVLVRCLERNRDNRYRDIGDVRIELERAQTDPQPSAEAAGRRLPLPVIAAVALVVAVLGAGAGWLLRSQPTRTPLNVAVPLMDRFETVERFRLSPNGETLAIIARERVPENQSVESAIYVRKWSESAFRKLPGTDRAHHRLLMFSPSGDQILFRVRDEFRPAWEMRTAPLAGGPGTRLYAIEQNGLLGARIGYRSEDELVALSDDDKNLYRVPADGGTPELIAPLTGRGDRYMFQFQMPHPGGRFLVASTWSPSTMSSAVYRIDLESGEASMVLENAGRPHFLPGGFMAFMRDQSLWVVPFDAESAQVTGTAVGYLSDVGGISLDRNGERAVYTIRDNTRDRSEIVIVDEGGRVLETLLTVPDEFQSNAALSPDGRRLAYVYQRNQGRGLWVLDIASGLTRQVSTNGEFVYDPCWLQDGRLAYISLQGADIAEPMVVEVAPGMTPQPLLPRTHDKPLQVSDLGISPDGRHVLLSCNLSDGREPGVYLFDMGDGDSARAFYASERNEGAASFRPDGKWVVYMTNGTGRQEIYLRPFVAENPESAPIYPVTRLGGTDPLWSPDGRTLYYRGVGAEADQFFAVSVETEPELEITERRTVFSNLDGVNGIVPMTEGRLIKLQATSQDMGDLPDMRLILDWDLPDLVAAQR